MEKIKLHMTTLLVMISACAISQTSGFNEEHGISNEEYQEILTKKENKVILPKKYILKVENNPIDIFYFKVTDIDKNCIVKPITIPMINYKEDEE